MDQFEQLPLQIEGGAFAVNSRRQVVFWNRTCERLLGVPARAALGQPCFKVIRANEASGRRFRGRRSPATAVGQRVSGSFATARPMARDARPQAGDAGR